MAIMALAGITVCSMGALSENSRDIGVHFFYLYGLASLLGGLILVIAACHQGHISQMGWRSWKWVVLRGASGTLIFIFAVLALACGAPLGDTSALSCINVVLAALLGRAFLGEALRGLHVAALTISVVGALVISKPEFLFGKQSEAQVPVAGYCMALASGVSSGFTFIAARRAHDVSPIIMTASVMIQEGIATMVLPMLGLVDELPAQLLWASPLKAIISVLGFLLLALLACGTTSFGAQLCPAAASSTIFSATSMSLGYALQTALHDEAPEFLTGSGAFLMLLGVALMAWARKLYREPTSECDGKPNSKSSQSEAEAHQDNEQDDSISNLSESSYQSSLASFAASEWSGVRLRPNAAAAASPGNAPVALALGMASA